MGKTLVTAQNCEHYLEADQQRIVIKADMILAPSAKDALSRRGITNEYQRTCCPPGEPARPHPEAEATAGQTAEQPEAGTDLVQQVVRLLRGEYGIDDPKTIEKITLEVLARANGQTH